MLTGTVVGSSLFWWGAETLEWIVGIVAVGVIALALWRFKSPVLTPALAATAPACGCATASRIVRPKEASESAPIACTLAPGDYKQRTARIRALAERSLRSARRDDLRLVLTYTPEAAKEVRALVGEEQACCAFLQFDVYDDGLGIDVTITAPEEARAAADHLFAHFAPELPLQKEFAT